MESKADVKAIMARFNTGANSMEGPTGGRSTVHATLSTGPPGQAKKVALEGSLSGGATAPKPNFLKSTVSSQSAPETNEFPRPKAFINKPPGGPEAGKSGGTPETGKPTFPKPQSFKPKPESATDGETKAPPLKPPPQKPLLSATLSDSKTISPKPPLAQAKPSWVKDSSKVEDNGSSSSSSPIPSKATPAPKPKSTLTVMRSQTDEVSAGETSSKSYTGSSVKSSAFLAAQNAFNKENTEDTSHNGPKPFGSHDNSVPKIPIAKKPSLVKRPVSFPVQKEKENEDPSAPKKNPLPNILALGSPPAKPNRPPKVNLEKFKSAAEQNNIEGSGDVKKTGRPPPPAFHPSSNAAPPMPSQLMAPSLPPRPTGAIIQPDPDENYDDIGVMSNPPPLPTGGNSESGSDEEMYEDLDDRWSSTDAKELEKKKEKEEKKRQEQEKKEQKDKEKKEQEIRKRFKISGPIQVIHKVKARVDCKGNKMDLSVKQGEPIEIVRITDNPEGRWLGRTRDGSYGYVKTESVDIDFDTLKRKSGTLTNQANADPEVYDDVGAMEDSGRCYKCLFMSFAVILPPPPGEDGEIYDELDDSDLNVSEQEPKPSSKPRNLLRMLKGWDDWRRNSPVNNQVPPPPQFTPDANTDNQTSTNDEEVYDDVDSQPGFSASNPASSLSMKPKGKPEERDPKKQKKFEKEEKEFRKKFKFDGEIQVLYQVTVLSSLSNKKWGGKDLPLRPGETLDVIVKPVDNKMVCRNEDGKFGYVSTSSIVAEDSDIYDDIGDDCIYDND
ncbi:FYN-binding protein-like isoform X1 [Arapaima gigas]